jgi:hypothetical protein
VFSDASTLVVGRPIEARQGAMQYVEQVVRAAEVQTVDMDGVLLGVDGLET